MSVHFERFAPRAIAFPELRACHAHRRIQGLVVGEPFMEHKNVAAI